MHIFLYGPSGSGKSTLAKELANALNINILDLDAQIEIDLGASITNTITEKGDEVFRNAEMAALKNAVAPPSVLSDISPPRGESLLSPPSGGKTNENMTDSPPPRGGVRGGAVIALGGGALLRDENRAIAEENGTIIFLEADVPTLVSRLTADDNKRPLLAGELSEKLTKLLEARAEHYGSFKTRVDAAKSTKEIVWDIQRKLGRYHLRAMPPSYDVIAEEGGLDNLGEHLKALNLNDPMIVVSDSNVAPLYMERTLAALEKTGINAQQVVIPAGEDHKTLESVHKLWGAFLKAGLDRKSTVISLGGGVVSDLAGFAASSFMRGCSWVAIPTTLLAMVDASMGGKTGFDLPEGKNLVGAFHPPRLVLADANVLATLPERELRSGMAEVVKHGVIHDPELFKICNQVWGTVVSSLPEIVRLAMSVKVKIIEKDPFEQGIRASLNFGHTIGHAVELVSGFSILHGEAVAIGMVAEARLAERMGIAPSGIAEEIGETLVALGLPVEIPQHLPRPDLLRAMQMDKKKVKGVVKFALPTKIGAAKVGVEIEDLESTL